MNVSVAIRNELRKSLPVGSLQSRNVMGIVLSYFCYSEGVISLLQKINHSTRAYIMNAKGLPGFLVKEPSLHLLQTF